MEVPIFGGRWQPFHNGHLAVLRSIASQHERVALAIVHPDPRHPPDERFERFHPTANPFDYWQRVEMLQALLASEGLARKVLLVPSWHPRVSVEREVNYFPPALQRCWYVPLIDELEERKIEDLRSLGERVSPIDDLPPDVLAVRSTVVRALLAAKGDWAGYVPPAIAARLEQPTADAARWPIVAGRFQPLHNGQLWLIRHVVEQFGRAVVGIVHSETTGTPTDHPYRSFQPVHNPFSYWERTVMITDALDEAGLLDQVCIVPLDHPRKGVRRDDPFLPPEREWIIATVSEHELGKIGDLVRAGEAVHKVDVPAEFATHSSSEVKARIATHSDWESLVPAAVRTFVLTSYGVERISAAIAEAREEFAAYRGADAHRRFEAAHRSEGTDDLAAQMRAQDVALDRVVDHVQEQIRARETSMSRLRPRSAAPAPIREHLARWRDRRDREQALRGRLRDLASASADATRDARLAELVREIDKLGLEVLGDAWEE